MERTLLGAIRRTGGVPWLGLVLAVAAALRVWPAVSDHSIFWPDEIHQSLEQAHRAAFGYGLLSWEFRDGARSWLFPGVVAGIWRVASALGVESSLTLVLIARLFLVAGSVAAIWFAAKLAEAIAGRRAAIATAVVLATFPPSFVYAHRAMSETASAPLIAMAAWFLWQRTERSAMYAGAAIAVGSLLRYQNGLFALAFAIVLLPQRRYREALAFCSMGLGVALFGGLLDGLTWGQPFHSLLTYIKFNLLVDGASSFGVEPFSYYAVTLWTSVGPLLIVLLGLFCVGALVEPILAGTVAIYVLAHSVLPHKELRFLVPCFPLFATVAGIGAERVLRRLPASRLIPAGAALASSLVLGYRLVHLDYRDMGQYLGTKRAAGSIWRAEEEPTLLLAAAGQRQDLCGVAVIGARAAFTGGYTYLHRDVPLIYQHELCDAGAVNYVIRSTHGEVLPTSYQLTASVGPWGLYRRDGVCRPPLREDDRLLEGARDMGLGLRQASQASDGSLRLDLQRDAGAFVENWGHGEMLDCDMARWSTGDRSAIEFNFEPAEGTYQLTLRARSHHDAWPQTLHVETNGVRQRVGRLSPNLKTYSIDLPEGALQPGRNRIVFSFTRSVRGGANDTRKLTALFRAIEIHPRFDDFSIDVALTEARPHLLRGFYPTEQEGGMTFAWSEGTSSIVEGTLARPRSPYVLQTLAEAVPLVPSQRTSVFANDELVGTIEFSSKWRTQRLLVPADVLKPGKNLIRFDYEAAVKPATIDPSLRDERELAVRFRQIQLNPVVAGSSLDLGTPAARPFLVDGWSGDERDGDRNAVWTDGPRASVLLALAGIPRPVLRLSTLGYQHALPIAVQVSLNGKKVGAFAAPDGWQNIAVPLPEGNYSAHGATIEFAFDHTVRPSDRNPESADHRQLALRVDRIWVESEAGGTANADANPAAPAPPGMREGVAITR